MRPCDFRDLAGQAAKRGLGAPAESLVSAFSTGRARAAPVQGGIHFLKDATKKLCADRILVPEVVATGGTSNEIKSVYVDVLRNFSGSVVIDSEALSAGQATAAA